MAPHGFQHTPKLEKQQQQQLRARPSAEQMQSAVWAGGAQATYLRGDSAVTVGVEVGRGMEVKISNLFFQFNLPGGVNHHDGKDR